MCQLFKNRLKSQVTDTSILCKQMRVVKCAFTVCLTAEPLKPTQKVKKHLQQSVLLLSITVFKYLYVSTHEKDSPQSVKY